ncbi:MAG: glycerol-3-phosphate dehydrogenase/oxidase, partial [Chloroflexi bacterium]|nr:glycerol-3-phosphate dehydrogenase/oxidase [Chloroflexota bacterium]
LRPIPPHQRRPGAYRHGNSVNSTHQTTDPLAQRAAAIDALGRDRFDALIVGGGITGVGALLDATARGLRAALVESDDLAVGTSSRSSKLIHGGLRYLEQFRFGLVREALAERATLLRIAGHLVHLETFAVPLYGSPLQVPYMGAGLMLYGLLGAGFPTYQTPGAARRVIPSLKPHRLRGTFTYRDGVEDDARLVIAVCRTAVARGAVVATRVRATGLIQSDGRVVGVEATDLVSGQTVSITAAAVIVATGATGGPGGPFAADAGAVAVMPSLGVHLIIERDRIPAGGGLTIQIPGRVLFLIPWGQRWIIGTTDDPYDGPADRPVAPDAAVDEILANVNDNLDVGLTRADILATYAGIRPLAATKDSSTVKASREHVIGSPLPGLITVRGGKYTTYRRIAADAVDAVLGARAKSLPSATGSLLLVGAPVAGAPGAVAGAPKVIATGAAASVDVAQSLDAAVLSALRARYGTETDALITLGAERGLLDRLHPDTDHLEVEVTWAVEQELALGLDDILARRLRLSIETRDHGASVAARTASIVGPALGWDDARQAAEVARYVASSALEYGVP